MNPRATLAIALLAAGAAYHSGSPTPASGPSAKERTPATAAAGSSVDQLPADQDWPRITLHEYFTTSSKAQELARREDTAGQRVRCTLGSGTEIEFVIATVPDPQNSHFPYMFDRFVESITRGAQDSHYSLDRYWLPWDMEKDPPDTDWLKREQHSEWRSTKLRHPGMLVFRGDSTHAGLLAVLLVGEDPVGGINKQQFAAALSLMSHFQGLDSVRVLGPTFSGSSRSLNIAMRSGRSDAGVGSYQVTTGSATARINEGRLKESLGGAVVYEPAINYDDTAQKSVLRAPFPVAAES
jgi:hypothetical protein